MAPDEAQPVAASFHSLLTLRNMTGLLTLDLFACLEEAFPSGVRCRTRSAEVANLPKGLLTA